MTLTEFTYALKPSRYFADGKRISRDMFEYYQLSALHLDCFVTRKAKAGWWHECHASRGNLG